MKKFFAFISVIVLAYIVSYYTVGKEKDYELFAIKNIEFFEELGEIFEDFNFETNEKDKADISEEDIKAADLYFKSGMKLFNQQLFTEAYEQFDKAFSYNPNNYDAKFQMGKCDYYLDYYEDAIVTFDEILYETEYDSAHYYKGLCSYNLSDYPEGINNFYAFIDKVPQSAEAHLQLSQNYYYNEQLAIAIETCTKAIEFNPNYSDAYFWRAYLYIDNEQYNNGISDNLKTLELDPTDYYAAYNCGYAYNNLENKDSALYYYNKTIEINPEYCDTYNSIGLILYYKKKYEDAYDYFSKTIECDESFYYAYNNRGDVLLIFEKYQEAIIDYKKVYLYSPDNIWAFYHEGLCWDKLKNYDLAIECYKNYLNYAEYTDYFYEDAQKRIKEIE